jgi:hypothetical protein
MDVPMLYHNHINGEVDQKAFIYQRIQSFPSIWNIRRLAMGEFTFSTQY